MAVIVGGSLLIVLMWAGSKERDVINLSAVAVSVEAGGAEDDVRHAGGT